MSVDEHLAEASRLLAHAAQCEEDAFGHHDCQALGPGTREPTVRQLNEWHAGRATAYEQKAARCIAAAQTHATLALALATLGRPDG